jgi:uncharacterized phiE125 gp8 family phage protein
MIKYENTAKPSGTVVPLATAKSHMVVEHAADDELINLYLQQASAWCSAYSGIHLLEQEWTAFGDTWCDIVALPFSPVRSIVITYIDEDGNTQTLADDQYYLDSKSYPAQITQAPAVTWPDLGPGPNVVTVVCQTGSTTTSDSITAAVLLLATHLYEQRSETSSLNIRRIPHGVTTFLDMVKLGWAV